MSRDYVLFRREQLGRTFFVSYVSEENQVTPFIEENPLIADTIEGIVDAYRKRGFFMYDDDTLISKRTIKFMSPRKQVNYVDLEIHEEGLLEFITQMMEASLVDS